MIDTTLTKHMRISEKTKKQLDEIGKKSETYYSVIRRLLKGKWAFVSDVLFGILFSCPRFR